MNIYSYLVLTGLVFFVLGFILGKGTSKKKESTQTSGKIENAPILNSRASIKSNNQIRAVQTRGRSGTSVEEVANEGIYKGIKSTDKNKKPELNFSGIGVASAAEKDDLKKINGIGPYIEKKLNNVGIYTYKQISRFTDYEIETVTQLIEFFPGRIKRDNWKQQALLLLEETHK